jgi:plasmid stabilization system protein ParE
MALKRSKDAPPDDIYDLEDIAELLESQGHLAAAQRVRAAEDEIEQLIDKNRKTSKQRNARLDGFPRRELFLAWLRSFNPLR